MPRQNGPGVGERQGPFVPLEEVSPRKGFGWAVPGSLQSLAQACRALLHKHGRSLDPQIVRAALAAFAISSDFK
jgi:hypothetical protein